MCEESKLLPFLEEAVDAYEKDFRAESRSDTTGYLMWSKRGLCAALRKAFIDNVPDSAELSKVNIELAQQVDELKTNYTNPDRELIEALKQQVEQQNKIIDTLLENKKGPSQKD